MIEALFFLCQIKGESLMSEATQKMVSVSSTNPESTPAKLATQYKATQKTWTKKAAVKKGMRIVAIGWGMALFTILIPIVHFVAPPALLLLSPLAGWGMYKLYSGKTDITVENALCPNCGEKIDLPSSLESWPVHGVCLNCKKGYVASLLA
jgi:hypothetical protein